jgi:hypothetical protein
MTNATTDRSNNDKQHKRALLMLLEKGVASIGLGAACLVAPSFLEPSPTANSIAAGLRMGGWIAIAVGLVLLGVRFSVQSKARKLSSLPRRDNGRLESHQDRPDQDGHTELPVFGSDAGTATQSFAMGSSQMPVAETLGASRQDVRVPR